MPPPASDGTPAIAGISRALLRHGHLVAAALLGFLWAWCATSGPFVMGINWDTASYLAAFASGQSGWTETPWNSHLAVGNVYILGAAVTRALGGTWIDGARLANALSVAAATTVLSGTAARLLQARWHGLVVATAWLT